MNYCPIVLQIYGPGAFKGRFYSERSLLLPEWRPEAWDHDRKLWKEVIALAEGIVKWFSNKKGYGFIEQDDGPDIFVHYSSIDMQGFKTLRGGDRVAFEVNDSDRGPEADKVKKL